LQSFCVQIGGAGYLAVEEWTFPHRDLGPVVREDASDRNAPFARHCVWAWRVGNSDGWSLQCSNWPWGPFNGFKGERVSGQSVAPDIGTPGGSRLPPHLTYADAQRVGADCRRAREEMSGQRFEDPLRAEQLLPRLDNVVDRQRK
jgi:hypothetical protein